MNGCRLLLLISLTSALLCGCSAPEFAEGPRQTEFTHVTIDQAIDAARDTLVAMHFQIETLDPEAGLIRTRPLTGQAFFELWRSDSIGAANAMEANLHSVRRDVELTFQRQGGSVHILCDARVYRLSLPGRNLVDTHSLPGAISQSSGELLTMRLHPRRQQQMAWLHVGSDALLAQRVLDRIENNLKPEAIQ